MVRLSVTENGTGIAFQDSGLTIFMVGMIAASISMMSIVIFACAKSSTKRKNKNNPYSDSTKIVVNGKSNKAQQNRATSAPVRSEGEILVSAAEIATTFVDIPSTDDVCNTNNDGGKDPQCHGDTTKHNDSTKNNDVNIDCTHNNYVSGDNNNNMGGGHTHASANTTTSGGGGHHHGDTSGTTSGGWSSDHGGSSWGGGGGGFSGGDTGVFSGGGW
ncbi:abscisic acid and environmental stress-inducible protein-like [Solanum dulcamara]|uniref:abscisic acid and environmental stress-inducible protein-like n=1 Tax=Solanum dulcamara TaxID=45834 RepID=UPI002484FF48|nr:abscisic acid and environmental stress-inducible protein-like [Solanum dulcamara]